MICFVFSPSCVCRCCWLSRLLFRRKIAEKRHPIRSISGSDSVELFDTHIKSCSEFQFQAPLYSAAPTERLSKYLWQANRQRQRCERRRKSTTEKLLSHFFVVRVFPKNSHTLFWLSAAATAAHMKLKRKIDRKFIFRPIHRGEYPHIS